MEMWRKAIQEGEPQYYHFEIEGEDGEFRLVKAWIEFVDEEPCETCGDRVPAEGYWVCPSCDAEWDEDPIAETKMGSITH